MESVISKLSLITLKNSYKCECFHCNIFRKKESKAKNKLWQVRSLVVLEDNKATDFIVN